MKSKNAEKGETNEKGKKWTETKEKRGEKYECTLESVTVKTKKNDDAGRERTRERKRNREKEKEKKRENKKVKGE